jgi:hypothetical protein
MTAGSFGSIAVITLVAGLLARAGDLVTGRALATSLLGESWWAASPFAATPALLAFTPVALVDFFAPFTPVEPDGRRSETEADFTILVKSAPRTPATSGGGDRDCATVRWMA